MSSKEDETCHDDLDETCHDDLDEDYGNLDDVGDDPALHNNNIISIGIYWSVIFTLIRIICKINKET